MNGGSLTYAPFAMKDQTNAVNVIPDFSHAGYKKGGVPLPDVPVQFTLTPTAGDNRAAIQAAIDQVEAMTPDANGFRGAVLLKKGIYEVNGSLTIEASGVVLRGEGQGDNGTVLNASLAQKHDFILVQGTGSGINEDTLTTVDITTAYVPVGTTNFNVSSASGFTVGDLVSVKRTPNQTWIDALAMGQYGWTPSGYVVKNERTITAINGNTITVDLPIVDVIEDQYGGGTLSKASVPGRISNCGVENLRIKSYYASDTDENHVWIAVKLIRTTDSWVKGVTAQYCGYSCVSIHSESNFNTIEECAMKDQKSQITGGRRYSFNITDGLGNLFQRCYTSDGRHDFVTGSRVAGPNVFLDSYATNTYSDVGPHHRWATGLLFDNVRAGQIRVQNRGASGTGHGWAGAQTMFWNLKSYKSDIKVASPKGARNWGIGCEGSTQNGDGFWEHWNSPVLPRSLYLQQLEDRLGTTAVANITIPEQLTGDIYSMLADWAGDGPLVDTSTNKLRIVATEDAFVRGGTYAGDNYGQSSTLTVKVNSNADYIRESFLKFDLSAINQVVGKATLRLRVTNDDAGPTHVVRFVSDDSWSESTITWNNKPSTGASLGSAVSPPIGEWFEIDITSQVQTELAGDDLISLNIHEITNNQFVQYGSTEHADSTYWPEIEIIYANISELTTTDDAFVRGGTYAGDNYGTNSSLVVKGHNTDSYRRESYLKFDLSGITETVTNATLRLKVNNDDAGPTHALRFVSDDSWSESTITWNNKPATGTSLGSATSPAIGEWFEVDITAQVQTELSGDGVISLNLHETSNNNYVSYHSNNAADSDNFPRLVLTTIPQAANRIASAESSETALRDVLKNEDRPEKSPILYSYPNPFQHLTNIVFTLEDPEPVNLLVYDLRGRLVNTLLSESLAAGSHRVNWNGTDSRGRRSPAGIYLLRLKTANRQVVEKVMLLE